MAEQFGDEAEGHADGEAKDVVVAMIEIAAQGGVGEALEFQPISIRAS